MPTKPLIPCRATGCSALVTSGFCLLHKAHGKQAWQDYEQNRRRCIPALAAAADIRSTSQWQKVRALHRALYPLCCDPFGYHRDMPATNQQSHHIVPLIERPDLAFVLSNLGPTCTRCHAQVEGMERAGKPTAYLFTGYQANTLPGPAIG